MKTSNRILLKPTITRIQKVFFFLLATIFMGGMAWGFKASEKPASDFVVYFLFFISFVLFTSFLQSLLALKGTKIELFVNSKTLRIGETLDMSWESSLKADRIKKLTLSLFLMETHTRGQGEDKSSTNKKLHDEILFETQDLNEILSGSKSIIVSKIFKPSYSNDNYSLGWFLKVNGDIPGFPDIDEDYKITFLSATEAS